MSISASHIVEALPRVLRAGGHSLRMNGLVLTTDSAVPAGTVLQFVSAADAQQHFDPLSALGGNVARYFNGFDNSWKKPSLLYVARHVAEDAPGWMRGGPVSAAVARIRAVDAGSLTISVDGTRYDVSELDCGAISSYSDAAQVVQNALAAAGAAGVTVRYSSLFKAFTVTSGTTGAESSVSFASPTGAGAEADLGALLGLTEAAGGVTSPGMQGRTLAETLDAALGITRNWVTLTTDWQATDDEIVALRQWSENQGSRFWVVSWVPRLPAYLDAASTGHVAARLRELDLGGGNLILDSLAYALFQMGMTASVDYDASVPARGKIVFMFKSQEGLAFNCDNEADAEALKDWGISFYGNYATAGDQFMFYAHGNTWGKYPFIDTALDAIWLNNEIQLTLLNLFRTVLALPYNEEGYARIRSAVEGEGGPVARAIANGVIRPGVRLNQAQKDQVNAEAGRDIAAVLEHTGAYFQVVAPSAQVRQHRGTPDANLWYTDAGGIQKIEMTSTVAI